MPEASSIGIGGDQISSIWGGQRSEVKGKRGVPAKERRHIQLDLRPPTFEGDGLSPGIIDSAQDNEYKAGARALRRSPGFAEIPEIFTFETSQVVLVRVLISKPPAPCLAGGVRNAGLID